MGAPCILPDCGIGIEGNGFRPVFSFCSPSVSYVDSVLVPEPARGFLETDSEEVGADMMSCGDCYEEDLDVQCPGLPGSLAQIFPTLN